jgi:uncharacterized protein (DUF4415 family)
MKRKKRVRRKGKIAYLRASGGVEQGCSASYGASRPSYQEQLSYREQQAEIRRWRKIPKKRVTINLDADILAWFREMGRGYQWEINRALRKVMEGQP